jgi:hypothetical protein
LAQRFTPAAARLGQAVLACAVQQVVEAQPAAVGLLARFNGVYVRDSSVVSLPAALASLWAGTGGSQGATAALKLQVRLEVGHGQLAGPVLQPAREPDSHSPFQSEALPAGALRMGDLAFFSLQQFACDQLQGVYTLSRYKAGLKLYDLDGQALDLLAWLREQSSPRVERPVRLGKKVRFACRLLVERVPPAVADQRRRRLKEYARKKQVTLTATTLALADWTLLLTDLPPQWLSIDEALVLAVVRWQIELLFKLWKSLLQVDDWRSEIPWRILCELYAKLLGAVILHWTTLVEFWQIPHRSLWKAALMVRHFAVPLAQALLDPQSLDAVLLRLQSYFRQLCHLDHRRAHPSTSQRLLAVAPPFLEH